MSELKRYGEHVSDEPLEIIAANECDAPINLATQRFRRLWNEIVDLRAVIAGDEPTLAEQEIADIAGGCMETGCYNLFMTYVKEALWRKS